jgi:hypothetical protein
MSKFFNAPRFRVGCTAPRFRVDGLSSYRGQMTEAGRRMFPPSILCHLSPDFRHPPDGGADRDRTGDLKLAKLALSQLSYGPARKPFSRRATLAKKNAWWACARLPAGGNAAEDRQIQTLPMAHHERAKRASGGPG